MVAAGLGQAGDRAQPAELRLAQRRPGLGDQTGDGHDPGRQLAHAGVAAVARGDRARRVERVRPGGADLVGPRQDDDRVDRRGVGDRPIDERLEEIDVGAMEVAHQVEDRVGLAGPIALVVEERPLGPLRGSLAGGREAGRVDERQLGQLLGRPADLDPLDRVHGQVAEIDRQRAVLTVEREVARAAGPQVGDDLVAERVAVPGHDPGALAGVGGGQALADQRVQERRLARLDPAGDRHPQRLVEPAHRQADRCLLGPAACDVERLGPDAPDLRGQVARAHRGVHPCARAGPCSCRCSRRWNGWSWRPGCTSGSRRRAGR